MTHSTPWRALHCFWSDPVGLEQFLLDVAVPELERLQRARLLQRWFYIRYHEGGHHLRLRVSGMTDERYSQLVQTMRQALQARLPAPADQGAAPHWMRSDFGEGSVIEFPYQAEVQRYGGPDAMPIAEQLFCASSHLAATMVRLTGTALPAKLAIAAELMVAGVAALELDPAAAGDFYQAYARYWERFLGQHRVAELTGPTAAARYARRYATLLSAVRGSASPSDGPALIWLRAMHDMVRACRGLGERGQLLIPDTGFVAVTEQQVAMSVAAIIASQIHMMNNRLGVSPGLECRLGRMLTQGLSVEAAA